MFPILSLSFFVHSLSLEFSSSISSFFSFIVSIILCSFALLSFHHLQFLSNLVQYSSLYLLSDQPNSFLAINYPGSSSPKCSLFSFLFPNIFHILSIFFLKFFDCFFCILQIFLPFPSIGFSYKPFLSY